MNEKFIAVIGSFTKVPIKDITVGALLVKDLGYNIIDIWDLAGCLEETYNIKYWIANEVIDKWETVGDIYNYCIKQNVF